MGKDNLHGALPGHMQKELNIGHKSQLCIADVMRRAPRSRVTTIWKAHLALRWPPQQLAAEEL